MSNCPECGGAVSRSAVECPSCGAALSGATFSTPVECPHCSERISSEAEACPACGELREARQCSTHAERAAAGQCVVCCSAVCASCNRGGDNHYLCETHCDVSVVGGWAQIYSTSDDLEAELIKDNLEAEGVDARILSQKDHFSLPVDLGDLSPVRILVPAFAYEAAERLLDEHRDELGQVAFGDDQEPPTA
jgi:hypothetical protein